MISDEENKINSNYYQIGKLYVELHKDDCEDNFCDMINDIVVSENKIREYINQIHNITGMVKCTKCGSEVSAEFAFCVACGNPMEVQQPKVQKDKVCPACGFKTNDSEYEFCYRCGSKLVEATEQESSDAVRNSVVDVKSVQKCSKCGFITDDPELLFCTECGTKFR